jgi:hypothetical protein
MSLRKTVHVLAHFQNLLGGGNPFELPAKEEQDDTVSPFYSKANPMPELQVWNVFISLYNQQVWPTPSK